MAINILIHLILYVMPEIQCLEQEQDHTHIIWPQCMDNQPILNTHPTHRQVHIRPHQCLVNNIPIHVPLKQPQPLQLPLFHLHTVCTVVADMSRVRPCDLLLFLYFNPSTSRLKHLIFILMICVFVNVNVKIEVFNMQKNNNFWWELTNSYLIVNMYLIYIQVLQIRARVIINMQ